MAKRLEYLHVLQEVGAPIPIQALIFLNFFLILFLFEYPIEDG